MRALAAAWLQAAAWLVLLYLVASPWRDLGGIVGERLRWLLRVGVAGGLWAGFVAADALLRFTPAPAERPCRSPRVLRALYYPPAIGAALAMAVLEACGAEDGAGAVLAALVAYGAGAWLRLAGLVGSAPADEEIAKERS
jgi:hypothetical protein